MCDLACRVCSIPAPAGDAFLGSLDIEGSTGRKANVFVRLPSQRYDAWMLPRVLVVAGSDSSGGAGLQADTKTITVLGGYAATAVTALTAQNTLGVAAVMPVAPEFVAQQMEVVLTDIGADCIKTGMLGGADTIEIVVRVLERLAPCTPLVVDPVMQAKGGAALLEAGALHTLKRRLIPRAALVTPNVPEAEALTGAQIDSTESMTNAASLLLALGPGAVLLKGGHLDGDEVIDVLLTADGDQSLFVQPRQATRSTHGTGCTLASAIATGIAEGLTLRDSIARAERYVTLAIQGAPGFGRGHGPLDHGHPLRRSPTDPLDPSAGD